MKALLIFILITASAYAASTEEGKPRFMSLGLGGGLAPDELFIMPEFGYQYKDLSSSILAVVTPGISMLNLKFSYKPFEFLEFGPYVGLNRTYHSMKGLGVTPMTRAQADSFIRSSIESRNEGKGALATVAAFTTNFYWSTFDLLPIQLEGAIYSTLKYQRLADSLDAADFYYEPSYSAVISKEELSEELDGLFSWRLNPAEKRAKRVGVYSSNVFLRTYRASQHRLGPAVQIEVNDSPLSVFVTTYVNILDRYEERKLGALVYLSWDL